MADVPKNGLCAICREECYIRCWRCAENLSFSGELHDCEELDEGFEDAAEEIYTDVELCPDCDKVVGSLR
jgi:hypothetical protein